MAKGKNRYQFGAFFDIPVTLPMWQLLDRLLQLKIQLACAMGFFRPTKREKKSARLNFVGAAVMASKF